MRKEAISHSSSQNVLRKGIVITKNDAKANDNTLNKKNTEPKVSKLNKKQKRKKKKTSKQKRVANFSLKHNKPPTVLLHPYLPA